MCLGCVLVKRNLSNRSDRWKVTEMFYYPIVTLYRGLGWPFKVHLGTSCIAQPWCREGERYALTSKRLLDKFFWLWKTLPFAVWNAAHRRLLEFVCCWRVLWLTLSRACVCLRRERKQGTNPSLCPIFGPLEQPLSQFLPLWSTSGSKRRGLQPDPFSAPPDWWAELPLPRVTFVRETKTTASWGVTQIGGHSIFTSL